MSGVRQVPLTCSGHTRPVVDLAFSDITPYGYFVISACKDGKPMLRRGDTGDWVGTFEGHSGAVWACTLNKEASRGATGAADFTAKVWDSVTGTELHSLQHNHIVKSVDFSPDSSRLLTGSNEKLLRIWDLSKPDTPETVLEGHKGTMKGAVYSHDGATLLSLSEDKTLRVWDPRASTPCVKTLELPDVPHSMELSRGGSVLSLALGNKVVFYDAATLEKRTEHTLPCPTFAASLHPTDDVFVAGGDDFKLYKLDYNTGQEMESYKGHFGPVHRVRFSPDGALYASGSEDGTLRLWQTTVGQTYGLWRAEQPAGHEPAPAAAPEVLPQQALTA